jgi:hypothetical protein
MAQIIITIPDAQTLEGDALDEAIDMVDHVGQQLRDGYTSGHIGPQRHWTFQASEDMAPLGARVIIVGSEDEHLNGRRGTVLVRYGVPKSAEFQRYGIQLDGDHRETTFSGAEFVVD